MSSNRLPCACGPVRRRAIAPCSTCTRRLGASVSLMIPERPLHVPQRPQWRARFRFISVTCVTVSVSSCVPAPPAGVFSRCPAARRCFPCFPTTRGTTYSTSDCPHVSSRTFYHHFLLSFARSTRLQGKMATHGSYTSLESEAHNLFLPFLQAFFILFKGNPLSERANRKLIRLPNQVFQQNLKSDICFHTLQMVSEFPCTHP